MSWPSIYEQKTTRLSMTLNLKQKNKKIALLNWSLTKNYCWNFDFVFILKLNKNFDGKKQKEFLKDSKANIQKKIYQKEPSFISVLDRFIVSFTRLGFFSVCISNIESFKKIFTLFSPKCWFWRQSRGGIFHWFWETRDFGAKNAH